MYGFSNLKVWIFVKKHKQKILCYKEIKLVSYEYFEIFSSIGKDA